MIIPQLSRDNPEKILINIKNVDGSGSITTGYGAALVATAASGDGIGAVKTTGTAGNAANFCGVAVSDIAINAYGLLTSWGFAASIAISQSVGSWTITGGDILIQSATLAGTFTSVVTNTALSTANFKYIVAAGAGLKDTISNPNPYVSGLIRAI